MQGIFYLQSSYSMLENMIPLEQLIKTAKSYGYKFIALSDSQLHGSYELFKLADKYDIKAILGLEVKVLEPNETTFLIYVKEDIGYENLLKIAHLKAKNHQFDLNDLVKYQKGLIFITAGYNSIIDQTILYGNEDVVIEYITKYNNLFDNFYVGVSLNYEIQKNILAQKIYNICENKFKMLPIHQTSYLNDEDKEVFESLVKINNINNEISSQVSYKMLTIEEINSNFSKYNLLKKHSNNLVNSINFKLKFPKFEMPIYETNRNVSNKEFLKALAEVGLERRLKLNKITNYQPYLKRLEHELNVICNMNFENYFLIVYDFVKYAKDNNILVGPGRGSAAGSLVAYCLGITNVDPIKYDLMFERFLNPARMSMPDIDLDFPDNKRDLVIDYVKEKYGEEHICSISTFTSFQLKSSIRDIARVKNINPSRVNGIVEAVVKNKYDKTDREIISILNTASKIEGLYRQTGTHPAGIILSKQKLTKYIPMQTGAFDFNQSQYDMNTLEKLNLHKIDFLGIRNLAIISDIITSLEKQNIKINLDNIPLDDEKTFKLLANADTTGIFQLESRGMREVLKKLKPKQFEDIVATLALYRPGPMQNIDIYIARKNGTKFNYIHKDLEPILKKTYGIIIYQEQIMQIAQSFAGYDLFDADMLRVGVSKKSSQILEEERVKFVNGAIKQGYSEELAQNIYNYIVKFADYGFNRSHSVSYGLVAYQMAYLKANYYKTFMQQLLNNVIGNETQTNDYITELRGRKIKIYSPNLNISTNKYEIYKEGLIMPLTAIRGVSDKTVKEIMKERNKKVFNDFLETKERLSKIINSRQFENLIISGALDYFGYNLETLLENKDLTNIGYERFIKDFKLRESSNVISFSEKMNLEKNVLGINIKYSLTKYLDNVKLPKNTFQVSEIPKSFTQFNLIGFIKRIDFIKTKSNTDMAFITISDNISELDITVFSNEVKNITEIKVDEIVVVNIKTSTYNNKTSYIYQKHLKIN